eukprot:TRINITY_DN30_c0_g1_i3.p1 TRINITY_DN30_c0_g1~~TRINITY_DN30_c0_g1_i3.p1  ORF type:complete len:494 (-),score=109.91 TRINITY_DN30_c0_g1_i3:10-1491(-)
MAPEPRGTKSSGAPPPLLHKQHQEPTMSWFDVVTSYIAYSTLFAVGRFRDFFGRLFGKKQYVKDEKFTSLCSDFENFFTRRAYLRCRDNYERPINSNPGGWIDVMDRTTQDGNKTFQLTGKTMRCLNLGSYNYLGFAENRGAIADAVSVSIDKFAVSTVSARMDYGTTTLHAELERVTAEYVGKPASMVFGMGFNTNATTLPALAGPGSLLISDSLNHRSLVIGARSSHASVRVFRHDDMAHLERVIRESISEGQPRTHRPWRKIIIVVEGIYSMEGEILNLPEIVKLKKKYNCYLYVDEAHSIGALGARGRGVCEHTGVSPDDVDVLMGTFTKSFGAVGGYIAGSHELIAYMRSQSYANVYDTSLSTPCCQQILSAFAAIDKDVQNPQGRMARLKENSNYFRSELIRRGFAVAGSADSPIIPVYLFHPAKISAFSRECYARNIAAVVVGYPATPILSSRCRFCISAAHTREDLDWALDQIDEVGDLLSIKYK